MSCSTAEVSLSSAGRFGSTLKVSVPSETSADLCVVNSARVSLSKRHTTLSPNDPNLIRFLYRYNHWTPFGHPQLSVRYELHPKQLLYLYSRCTPGSERLTEHGITTERGSLWYWLRNKHLYDRVELWIDRLIMDKAPITAEVAGIHTLFNPSHSLEFPITDTWVSENVVERLKLAWMTVLVEAPVPIRTQLFKHKIGFCENEVSRRYVDAPPHYFLPENWRARAPTIKQGSLKTPIKWPKLANLVAKSLYFWSDVSYRTLLRLDVCPEQARFLLPQGMTTQWYWTGSLEAFVRAINLRTAEHAQEESWKIMQNIKRLMQIRWPLTYRMTFER